MHDLIELRPHLALPLSAECLKDVTGLTNMRYQDMDAWSQAMIDGIADEMDLRFGPAGPVLVNTAIIHTESFP